MEATELKPGICYKVFFEKRIPIEFKFLLRDEEGKIVCQSREGKVFNFNSLEQYLAINEVYPEW